MKFRRTRQESGEWQKPLLQQRGWLLSAGFLLTMLMFAGVAAVIPDGDEESPAPEPEASRTVEEPKDGANDEAGGAGSGEGRPPGCRTDDSDNSVPKKAPEDVKWKPLGSTTVPVSRSAGPKSFDTPVWSCYAHTPMGAVLAAHSITTRISYPGWRELAKKQMVPGQGRDRFLKERAKEKDKPLSSAPEDGRYAGFQVLSYTPSRTSLLVLMEYSEGAYFSLSVNMQWRNGDWKLVLNPDGSYSPDPSMVSDKTGFVTWGK